jgi:hypothetical protein
MHQLQYVLSMIMVVHILTQNIAIIDIRGTFEMQGASKAFVTMNNAIFDTIPGGKQVSPTTYLN